MKLQEQLNFFKMRFQAAMPKELLVIMQEATKALADSELMEDVIAVGANAPSFTLKTSSGEAYVLEEMLARGPLLLNFQRGNWCSYCKIELDILEAKIAGVITEMGASMVAISPQNAEDSATLRQEKNLSFPILHDAHNEVAAAYGIRHELPEALRTVYQNFGIDLPQFNGDDSWTLPMAATLLIDTQGVVRHVAVNADHTLRPEPEDTLAALQALG